MNRHNVVEHIAEPPAASLVCDEVECELVSLQLADGYFGWGRFFSGNSNCRAILYLHGIQSHGGWFLRSCDYLRRRGHTVLAPDRRGSGLNQQDRGHCHNPDQLIEDVDHCVDWLCDKTGKSQIDIVAVSWSGKLALAYGAKFARKVRSIALVGPGLCARVDISLREKIAVGVHGVVDPHKMHEIPLNEPTLFTANPAMLEFIENDPLKLTHTTASFLVTSHRLDMKVRKIVNKLNMPIYLFLAQHDRIIDNQATIELLRPALTSPPGCDESARIFTDAHHTLDFEPEPDTFFQELAQVFAQP